MDKDYANAVQAISERAASWADQERERVVAAVLTAELLPVPGCPGWTVALGPHHQEFARQLAAHAGERAGQPWVSSAAVMSDDALYAATVDAWRAIAPGWLIDLTDPERKRQAPRSNTASMVEHGAIARHLERAGHHVLRPAQTAAVHALRAHPDLAREQRMGFRTGAEMTSSWTLAELVWSEYSSLSATEARIDGDMYDDDERMTSEAVEGERVVDYVQRLARQRDELSA
jgi:hypothetical protein